MASKTVLSFTDISDLVETLITGLRDRGATFDQVHGVPRGGWLPASLVSERMGLQLVETPPTDSQTKCLIVDDIADSGLTAQRYADLGHEFVALVAKSHTPTWITSACQVAGDDWIVFPWELGTAEAVGPTDAVVRLLEFIGETPNRPGLLNTPRRVVEALAEMTEGYNQDPADHLGVVFPDHCDEMVVVTGIDFTSLCEHHMLTFTGTASIAYIPKGQVVGLSKLARVVDVFARRLQVQERLTEQIADAIETHLSPKGVGVIVQAHHSCMGCRGVRKPGARMLTSSLRGAIKTKPEARAEFLSLARPA